MDYASHRNAQTARPVGIVRRLGCQVRLETALLGSIVHLDSHPLLLLSLHVPSGRSVR